MKIHGYTIVVEPDEEAFHGYVPAIPYCHTCGDTVPETVANVKEALELCMEYIQEDLHQPLPPDVATQDFPKNLVNKLQFA